MLFFTFQKINNRSSQYLTQNFIVNFPPIFPIFWVFLVISNNIDQIDHDLVT